MSLFTRITATLVAGVDRTVARIEDHDAIIEASLREGRRAQARARVRLRQLQRDGESLRSRTQDLEKQITNWTERARTSHATNHQMALACVSRRKQAVAELAKVNDSLASHDALEQDVRRSLEQIGERLQQMAQQRNQLRTRESAAQANKVLNQLEHNAAGSVEDTFERWEVSISETEILNDTHLSDVDSDPLEATFVEQENRAELELELNALLQDDPTDKTPRETRP